MKLLSDATSNTKLRKSETERYRVWSLALSPADSAGGVTNCPRSTPGCRHICVGGERVGLSAVWPAIMQARIRKTQYLQEDRSAFIRQLCDEIRAAVLLAERHGRTAVFRLNTFSDLPWETPQFGEIPQKFLSAVFYDYTKLRHRLLTGELPMNYFLCASWDETASGQRDCQRVLESGGNVAIAFAQRGDGFSGNRALLQRLPATWVIGNHRYQVHDGDTTDLRFLDHGATRSGFGRIIGLRLKAGSIAAREQAMNSGFPVLID